MPRPEDELLDDILEDERRELLDRIKEIAAHGKRPEIHAPQQK